jgi:serine/threonine protein kinase
MSGGTAHDQQVLEFLAEFALDQQAGRELPLLHYLQRHPGSEEAVAREFLQLRERGRAAAGPAAARDARLGPYELLAELGSGGQGKVWLARDPRLQRHVALKILRGGARAMVSPERFRREARIAARLDHPGLCSVHDFGEDGDALWLAMHFVPGESLANLLQRARSELGPGRHGALLWPGTMPANEAGRIHAILAAIERSALALHHAHAAGILHRDVKPGNLVVTPTGDPVLVDFGLARDEGTARACLTWTGDLLGTPAYMPPELLGEQPVEPSPAIDLWGLAVVLFECLTLAHPFQGASQQALIQAIRLREPLPLRKLQPAASRDLELVLRTALDKDPQHRYRDAAAFADDLARLRNRTPPLARAPGSLLQLRRLTARHPAATTLVAMSFLGLAGALVLTEAQRRDEEQLRALATQRADELRRLARSVLFDLNDAVRDLPGATEANRLMADRAREFLALLRHDRPPDGDVDTDLVQAQLRLGDVLGNPHCGNLGRIDDAFRAYRDAAALLERTPRTPSTNRLRADCRRRLGELLAHQGDRQAALQQWHDALQLLAGLPDDLPTVQLLAMIHLRRGETLAFLRENAAPATSAEAEFAAAEDLLRRLLGAVPDPDAIVVQAAAVAAARARLALRRGDHAQALAAATSGRDQLAELAADHALQLHVRTLRADLQAAAGVASRHQQQPAQALEHLQAAVRAFDELVAMDPRNEQLARLWLQSSQELALVLIDLGRSTEADAALQQVLARRPAAALSAADRAIAQCAALAGGGAPPADALATIAMAHTMRGLLRRGAGDPAGAAADLTAARAALQSGAGDATLSEPWATWLHRLGPDAGTAEATATRR